MTYRSPVYTGFVIALALFAIGGAIYGLGKMMGWWG